jgi:hypothetical protein
MLPVTGGESPHPADICLLDGTVEQGIYVSLLAKV